MTIIHTSRFARLSRTLAAALALSLLAAACGDDDDTNAQTADQTAGTEDTSTSDPEAASDTEAASGEPVRIGVIASLTGPGAVIGVPFTDAAKIAVEKVNEEGGVLDGRPLELDIRDDETKPDVAVQLFEGLARDDVAWVMGPNLSATCYAVEPLAEQLDQPTFCWSSANMPEQHSDMYFGTSFDFTQLAEGHMQDFADMGIERFAMLTSTDASGKLYRETMSAAAEDAGIEITGTSEFEQTETDLTGTIAGLRSGNPQAYFIGTSGKPAAIALKNMQDLQIEEPVFIGFGNGSYVFAELVGSNIPDRTYVRMAKMVDLDAIADDDPMLPKIEEFIEAWESEYDTKADPVSSGPWDVVFMIAKAIEAAGGTEPEAMVEAMEAMTYEGANCTYEFSPDRHRGAEEGCVALTRLQGDGTFVAVDAADEG